MRALLPTARRAPALSAAALILLAPLVAAAHPGADAGAHHGAGFLAGLAHPFTGLDHLAAMVAVGLFGALTARRTADALLAPLAFVTALSAGALYASNGGAVPGIEPGIAASLLVFGLLVATRARLGAFGGAALVAGFALFHGAAHGVELSGTAALAGMVAGTAALHLAGLALGRAFAARPVATRVLGALVVAVGGAALLGAA